VSYYTQPRYWLVSRAFLQQHPNVEKLIWPNGFDSVDEHLGEFYHVSHTHPNATLLQLALLDCEIRYISGRSELYFPRWSKGSIPKLTYLQPE